MEFQVTTQMTQMIMTWRWKKIDPSSIHHSSPCPACCNRSSPSRGPSRQPLSAQQASLSSPTRSKTSSTARPPFPIHPPTPSCVASKRPSSAFDRARLSAM